MKLLSRGTNGNMGYIASGSRVQAFRGGAQSRLTAYLLLLGFAATALAAFGLARGYLLGSGWAVALLAVTAAISEKQRVSLSSETQASISAIPILFAAVLFGPIAAMVVAAVS